MRRSMMESIIRPTESDNGFMAMTMKIAVAGLGTVGAEVVRQVLDHHRGGNNAVTFDVVAVSARDQSKARGFSMEGISFVDNPVALAQRDDITCVVELIGGEDGVANELVSAAIDAGKHVVTANKALLAHHGLELALKAEARGVALAAEAAVAGGIPAVKILKEGLAGNRITRISGILNGTCNYILSLMQSEGRDFDDVLKEAQEAGYAEADPSFDIDGIDAAHKLALLASMGFGFVPSFEMIEITGIREISLNDIENADKLGLAIRLLAVAERHEEAARFFVKPVMVPQSSQLAKINGALNAVAFSGDPVDQVTTIGAGAGAGPTASAVLADLIDIAYGRKTPLFGTAATRLTLPPTKSDMIWMERYYVRLSVYDRPGVLADVTAVLRDCAISVESILQHGRASDGEDGIVSVILTTHEVASDAMSKALSVIARLENIRSKPIALGVADG